MREKLKNLGWAIHILLMIFIFYMFHFYSVEQRFIIYALGLGYGLTGALLIGRYYKTKKGSYSVGLALYYLFIGMLYFLIPPIE